MYISSLWNPINQSFNGYQGTFARYWPATFIMGLFWYGSLILYSKASILIGSLGPVVAWPLFMVLIILTSNFWGWRHREWAHCKQSVKNKVLVSISILIVAVLILGYSVTLAHTG